MLSLPRCTPASSVFGEQGQLFVVVCWLPIVVASILAEPEP